VLKTRLIPCLLLKDGMLVRSERFTIHQAIGYPLQEVRRFNEWMIDELIYLDISARSDYVVSRPDHAVGSLAGQLEVLDAIATDCFIPLTIGGGIRTLDDMRERFRRGADKITLNTAAVANPDLITEAARAFGSQAVVVSIDVRRTGPDQYEVHTERGGKPTGLEVTAWARQVEGLGAGEIFLTSIDRDGTGEGYDISLVRRVVDAVGIPVIASGGVGTYEDLVAGALDGGAAAVAAANIFHFKELSDRNAKRTMRAAGIPVRL
jgi:cyclase